MRARLMTCVLVLTTCLILLTAAQVSPTQSVSDWTPTSVPVEDEAKVKVKTLGRTEVKMRSKLPAVDSQTTEPDRRCAGVRTIRSDGPTASNIVIGPCCDCNRILLDGLYLYQGVTLSLFSSTPNATVPVTLGHGGPGRIGFSLNLSGPFTDSLVFNVNTTGSGSGSAVITFYIKGLDAGQSNMITTVSSGFTNPVPQMEVFACQCPPVP